jgi:hypothetical protein
MNPEDIARAIAAARDVTEKASPEYIAGWIEGLDAAATELCVELAKHSIHPAHFDPVGFLAACACGVPTDRAH